MMTSESLLNYCSKSTEQAVCAIAAFCDALWAARARNEGTANYSGRIWVDSEALSQALYVQLLRRELQTPELHAAFLDEIPKSGSVTGPVPKAFFELQVLAKLFLAHVPPADLKYFSMRALRRKHQVQLSSGVAKAFQDCVRSVRRFATPSGVVHSRSSLADELQITTSKESPNSRTNLNELFLELCAALGRMSPSGAGDRVVIDLANIDPGHLIGHLFGFPTSIKGFDQIFGSGLMLIDSVSPSGFGSTATQDGTLGGRTVLTVGPFGSGKSLLSLLMAVEVARKGGVAWVIALEQTVAECRYALSSIGVSTEEDFQVSANIADAAQVLSRPNPRGALVFLRQEEATYEQFLEKVESNLKLLDKYPLRMILIDPVSAIVDDRSSQGTRSQTLRFLETAKKMDVNVWLTAEQIGGSSRDMFAENVADTVMHLGSSDIQGSRQRFLEVTKSRMQQEQTGKQSLVISETEGFRIFPSTTVLSLSPEGYPPQELGEISLGIPGLDDILGPEAIRPGDQVVFLGPPGTSRSLSALMFLEGAPSPTTLLITDQVPSRVRELVGVMQGRRPEVSLKVCSVRQGLIEPGQLLKQIETEFAHYKETGSPVTRAVVSNLARWELAMPLVAADPMFAVALTGVLRRSGATCIIVCEDTSGSHLQRAVTQTADCVLQFGKFQFRGQERNFLRALKTRTMMHSGEPFEVLVSRSGIRINEASLALLRIREGGQVEPVTISLFLHAETENHARYTERILGAVKTTLSPHCKIEQQARHYDPSVLELGASSAIDELQILQLDEFQIPLHVKQNRSYSALHTFSRHAEELLHDRLPALRQLVESDHGSFIAVPFYDNISLLAYKSDFFDATRPFPSTWKDLAAQCFAWESENQDENELFFHCPVANVYSVETYNCFYFEILNSLEAPPDAVEGRLERWLNTSAAREAAFMFWRLCRRAHASNFKIKASRRATSGSREPVQKFSNVDRSAKVWRHWYNTLNQMLSELKPKDRSSIHVRPLFDNNTTAGEWYLAVPSYSAAPDVGLEVIRVLTSRQAELHRVRLGVGLPTRADFYELREDPSGSDSATVSPYFSLPMKDLRELVRKAFRRSALQFYPRFSATLSSHLQRVLEIGRESETDVRAEIDSVFVSMAANIRFIENQHESIVRSS